MFLVESPQNVELAQYINGSLIVLFLWGLLLSYKNRQVEPSLFIFAALELANITFGSNVFNGFANDLTSASAKTYYLNTIRDDLFTILSIMVLHFWFKVNVSKITMIAISVLLLNSALYAFMHIDIVLLQHKVAPWPWWDSFYTTAINTNEYVVSGIVIIYGYVANRKSTLEGYSDGV